MTVQSVKIEQESIVACKGLPRSPKGSHEHTDNTTTPAVSHFEFVNDRQVGKLKLRLNKSLHLVAPESEVAFFGELGAPNGISVICISQCDSRLPRVSIWWAELSIRIIL